MARNGELLNNSLGRAVVRALNAGADIMLISPDIHTAISEVIAAINNGKLPKQLIRVSVKFFDGNRNGLV